MDARAGGDRRRLLVSADSHVIEPPALWLDRLPPALHDDAPRFPNGAGPFEAHPGAWDPLERLGAMAEDGVSAEVLYPTLALNLFHLENAALQEGCFHVYNDWIAEYCSAAPERLVGVGVVSCYDMTEAVAEVERCHALGLRGLLLWQVPPESLAFHTDHYEPLWTAAQELELPVSLHILTGHDWSRRVSNDVLTGRAATFDEKTTIGEYGLRGTVNYKLLSAMQSLHDILISGVLERFPRLKLVLVETEIGWLPWVLSQWDKYFARTQRILDNIQRPPSEYFDRQVYATFFNDPPGTRELSWWGIDNCMWSNDFPHPNSTWPDSAKVIERDLGALQPDALEKVLHGNCARLYNIDLPALEGDASDI
jgi:predicted TIM-barrel fold metal-dependent hydrolase